MAREKTVLSQLGRAKWELWLENIILTITGGEVVNVPKDIYSKLRQMEIITDQFITDDLYNILTDEYGNVIIVGDDSEILKTIPTKLSELENDTQFVNMEEITDEESIVLTGN